MKSLFILVVALVGSSTSLASSPRPELEVIKRVQGTTSHEISGITVHKGMYFAVADSKTDTYVYRITPGGNNVYKLTREMDLSALKGFEQYNDSLKKHEELKKKDRRFDLEAIVTCNNSVFLANERVREILLVEEGALRQIPLDFSKVKNLGEGGANAGFEGLAVNCQSKRMYIGKERDPRFIIEVDLNTNKVVDQWDFEGSERQGQKVINPFTGEGHLEIGPDIADLHFQNGYLYALERNTFEIAKIDVKTRKVVSRVSYFRTEQNLYESGEPFGQAESLFIDKDAIIVGFDNGEAPYTRSAEAKHGHTGNSALFVWFKKPEGF